MRKVLAVATAATVLSGLLTACSDPARNSGLGPADPSSPAGGTAAPSETAGTAGETGAAGRIAWGPCTDVRGPNGQVPAKPDATLRCGSLRVPLDYAKPGGETLDIAMIRIPATDQARRIGSLVFNFGGPGASGVDTMAQAAKAFASLNTRYDLVSFDPRGVERSSGVRCDGEHVMDRYTSMNTIAVTQADWDRQERIIKDFAAACQRTSGKVLPYVGTVNAARDMDRMREALGEPKLNYFGISYGTQLGAVYATEFPKNVGRFVLDAPLDPSVSMNRRTVVQSAGFQHAYDDFLKDCIKGPGRCDIGADRTIANKNVEKFMGDVEDKPLKVGSRELTQGLANTGVAAALYSKLTWPLLEQGLNMAFSDDGRLLLSLADNYNGRLPDGSYTTLMSSFPAISCADTAERPDLAQLKRTQREALEVSPLFGSAGMGLICSSWPVKGSDEARKVNAAGSAPIVVIGGTGDPATPYEWAPKLTEQLGTGVLVTYKGEGHGAYISGDQCVKKVTDKYLIEGEVPAKGTTCAAS